MNWQLYIIRTGSGTLYTGITTDPERRLRQHEAGTGARSLRGRGPLQMEYCTPAGDRSRAQVLEAWVKNQTRARKEMLIRGELNLPSAPDDESA